MIVFFSSVLCGASYLQIHDEDTQDVHPPEEDIRRHEASLFVNLVQNGRWSCQELLQLVDLVKKLHSRFEEHLISAILEQCMNNSEDREIFKQKERSLIQEFVNHDQSCLLDDQKTSNSSKFCQIISVKELEEIIENNSSAEDQEEWQQLQLESTEKIFGIFLAC